MPSSVVNVVFAGLGGQGVIKASDVRFGPEVLSPMIPDGQADFLVVLAPSQVENNVHQLRPGGVLFPPDLVPEASLKNKRSLNVALLGALSVHLPIAEEHWRAALASSLPERLLQVNLEAFEAGRAVERARTGGKGPHVHA